MLSSPLRAHVFNENAAPTLPSQSAPPLSPRLQQNADPLLQDKDRVGKETSSSDDLVLRMNLGDSLDDLPLPEDTNCDRGRVGKETRDDLALRLSLGNSLGDEQAVDSNPDATETEAGGGGDSAVGKEQAEPAPVRRPAVSRTYGRPRPPPDDSPLNPMAPSPPDLSTSAPPRAAASNNLHFSPARPPRKVVSQLLRLEAASEAGCSASQELTFARDPPPSAPVAKKFIETDREKIRKNLKMLSGRAKSSLLPRRPRPVDLVDGEDGEGRGDTVTARRKEKQPRADENDASSPPSAPASRPAHASSATEKEPLPGGLTDDARNLLIRLFADESDEDVGNLDALLSAPPEKDTASEKGGAGEGGDERDEDSDVRMGSGDDSESAHDSDGNVIEPEVKKVSKRSRKDDLLEMQKQTQRLLRSAQVEAPKRKSTMNMARFLANKGIVTNRKMQQQDSDDEDDPDYKDEEAEPEYASSAAADKDPDLAAPAETIENEARSTPRAPIAPHPSPASPPRPARPAPAANKLKLSIDAVATRTEFNKLAQLSRNFTPPATADEDDDDDDVDLEIIDVRDTDAPGFAALRGAQPRSEGEEGEGGGEDEDSGRGEEEEKGGEEGGG
ncbi:hypothetical protein BDK51DRAFT_40705 [Blyttiomyces helicus]|uniref:DNA replication checkpoint mediator MRC1 domain-containing protein n=1 Tax=Blyttiomyces helicus TaxID=388810 RepID=A0A4P9W3L9_9FUNG|nr:hypothetical protein BDK51DRAFT_40705 [Blyttiomyces helicus]|eukprot:RKO86734.1 hypothetical protein BDK51DRAFT_40705 [Blyttiomyces helicus]